MLLRLRCSYRLRDPLAAKEVTAFSRGVVPRNRTWVRETELGFDRMDLDRIDRSGSNLQLFCELPQVLHNIIVVVFYDLRQLGDNRILLSRLA